MSLHNETKAYLCQLENPTVARPPRRGRGRLAFGGHPAPQQHKTHCTDSSLTASNYDIKVG